MISDVWGPGDGELHCGLLEGRLSLVPDPFVDYEPEGKCIDLPWVLGALRPRVRWASTVPDGVLGAAARDRLEAFRLPPPFLQVHDIDVSPGRAVAVVSDRFIGISAAQAAVSLREAGRRIPLDVWLGLADRLLYALKSISHDHPWWRTWSGPFSFGIDLDGHFVIWAGFPCHAVPWDVFQVRLPHSVHDLHFDWCDQALDFGGGGAGTESSHVWSACRVLTWVLDPYKIRYEARGAQWQLEWSHSEVNPALTAALNAGLEKREDATLDGLHRAILGEAGVVPAPIDRIRDVFFGAAQAALVEEARRRAQNDEALPERWRQGGIQVMVDHLLETCSPVERCPLDPRVAVASPNAADVPLIGTQTLQLQMVVDGSVVRRMPISRERALGSRFAPPMGQRIVPGQSVLLRLVHPEQNSQQIELGAELDTDGWVKLTPMSAEAQRRVNVLWSAIVAEPARAFLPRRPDEELTRRQRCAGFARKVAVFYAVWLFCCAVALIPGSLAAAIALVLAVVGVASYWSALYALIAVAFIWGTGLCLISWIRGQFRS